jgi:large subunit ribosomal protein L4
MPVKVVSSARSAKCFDHEGNLIESVGLNPEIFGVLPNKDVIYQVIVGQLESRRSGTQSTLTRSEIRGGGAKPYRQKGTGRARQGSTRSPQFVGGAVALGPKPRTYNVRTPKKMRRLALVSALSDRARSRRIKLIDDWQISEPKTKKAADTLKSIFVWGNILVIVSSNEETVYKSVRNILGVRVVYSNTVTTYDVIWSDWIVAGKEALVQLEERLSANA